MSGVLSVILLCGVLLQAKEVMEPKISEMAILVKAKQGVPHEINYQGWLGAASDTTGITDTLGMIFRLYTTSTGGAPIWNETHIAVPVDKGIFNVYLGEATPLPANIFTGDPLWLEVQVVSDTLSPRKKLVSVGYAIKAEYADNAIRADTANYVDTTNYAYNADKLDGYHVTSLQRTIYDGTVPTGSSDTLVIPDRTLWTLQLSSEWPQWGGVCFIWGFENGWYIGVTYIAYNGDGTSNYGGVEKHESSTDVIVQFGSGSYIYQVRCSGETTGDHNIILTTSGAELKYRLIY